MKRGLKSFIKGLGYVGLFLAMQIIGGIAASAASGFYYGISQVMNGSAPDMGNFGAWFEANMGNINDIGIFIGGLLTVAALFIIAKVKKTTVKEDVEVKKAPGKFLVKAALFGAGFNAAVLGAIALLPENVIEEYSQASAGLTSGGIVLTLLATAVEAPLVEELIFRGGMFRRFKQGMPKALAVVLSAVIFGICHGTNPVWFAYAALLGVILALMEDKTGSIIPGIITHFMFNFFSTAVLQYIESETVLTVIVIAGTLLAIVSAVLLIKDRSVKSSEVPVLVQA